MRKSSAEISHESVGRILDAATRLFASKGYHGVTTRQIAAASGLNIATVHHHLGGKRDVYLAVLRRFYSQEGELVQTFVKDSQLGVIQDAEHLRRILFRLADAQLTHVSQTPERAWLYMRRWLETTPGLTAETCEDDKAVIEFEASQSRALLAPLRAIVRQAEKQGLITCKTEPVMIIRGFDWLVYAYFTCGPIEGSQWRGDPCKPSNLRRFKKFMHAYLLSMLGLNV